MGTEADVVSGHEYRVPAFELASWCGGCLASGDAASLRP